MSELKTQLAKNEKTVAMSSKTLQLLVVGYNEASKCKCVYNLIFRLINLCKKTQLACK